MQIKWEIMSIMCWGLIKFEVGGCNCLMCDHFLN